MTELQASELRERAEELATKAEALRREIRRSFVGHEDLVENLLVALLASGHVLLEGLPGLGKTLLVHTLSSCLGLEFSRIQFTPDLMPTDITGTRMLEENDGQRQFRFQSGPVFANLVLADEINRATPKTQSALLEAMQEASVTVGRDTHLLPRPFAVVATQNPIELEGTYPLPEAQLDRFMFKLLVELPDYEELTTILTTTTGADKPVMQQILSREEVVEIQNLARHVVCGDHLVRFVAALIQATQPGAAQNERSRRLVRFGASPRAGQAMILAGKVRALLDRRPCVSREDLEACMVPALRHRVILGFEAETDGVGVEDLLSDWQQEADRRSR